MKAPRVRVAAAALLLALLVASVCTGRPAWANAAAAVLSPDNRTAGVFVARPTVLAVDHERIDFACDDSRCEFKAVYDVRNPSDAPEEVTGAFYGISTDGLSATADGVDVRRELSGEQLRAIDALAVPPRAEDVTRQGFVLRVEAHARVSLSFSGRMRPVSVADSSGPWGYGSLSPSETRHPRLATRWKSDVIESYAYALWPIRQWAGSPSIDVTVRLPSHESWSGPVAGWTLTRDDGVCIARRTLLARDVPLLEFRLLAQRGTIAQNGGPFLGLGARIDAPRFLMRFGYEGALPWWMIWSASVDTDFQVMTTITPAVELASPNVSIVAPSVALGAGAPVEIRAGQRAVAGARIQLTVSWPVFSLVLPVDAFPGATSDKWQVALFAQGSL